MTRTLPNDIIQIFKKLTNIEQLLYSYANVMQQIDNLSCGLFIIAYAIDIAFGIELEKSKYVFITNAFTLMKQHKS